MHFASSAHPSSTASRAANPRASVSAGRRRSAAANARVRFVYCHESSGETDQIVVAPAQMPSANNATRKQAPAASSCGAGSAPARIAAAATATARSANPPIHTSEESAVPRARKNAANASAPPVEAATAPGVARRSTRARTGDDASIAKDTADGPFTNGLHGRYAENTAVGETCRRLCPSDVWAVRHRSTGDRMLRTRSTRKTGLAAAVAVSALALLAVGASAASAAPAATQQATNTCWKTVVNDWLNNQPNLKGSYPIPCYTQAIQHLSDYPDIKQYSSAIDDIHRALLAAIHDQHDQGGPNNSGGPGTPLGPGGGSGGGNSTGGGTSSGGNKGLIRRIAADIGPSNAQSVPLPLLVLGGLALLLFLTAAATWLTRRLQARRVTPAPAPAPAASSVRPKP